MRAFAITLALMLVSALLPLLIFFLVLLWRAEQRRVRP